MAMPQQPITGVTMDTTCMVHTQESVNMMVVGMEKLQNAELQKGVSAFLFQLYQ